MFIKFKVLFFLFFLLPDLNAHEFNPAHLVIDEYNENQYEVAWMYPSKNLGLRALSYNFETIKGKVYIAGITSKQDQLDILLNSIKSIKGVREIVNYVIVK